MKRSELRKLVNEIHQKKNYPPAYIYLDIFIDHRICPVCYAKTTEEDMKHPNTREDLKIHKACWDMITHSWICKRCKKYFSKNEIEIKPPELGSYCYECFKKIGGK